MYPFESVMTTDRATGQILAGNKNTSSLLPREELYMIIPNKSDPVT